MATIKIQCSCGQEYAIEVEPGTNMAFVHVACPACGIDSANPANTLRIQSEQPKPVITHPPVVRVHVPPPTVASEISPGKQAKLDQAKIDARAKISWGDPPKEVIQYLMTQGYEPGAAMDLVEGMVEEREASLRGVGIKKMVIGFPIMLLPVLDYIHFAHVGASRATSGDAKVLGFSIVLGLFGLGIFVNGLLTLLFPKTVEGDIGDM